MSGKWKFQFLHHQIPYKIYRGDIIHRHPEMRNSLFLLPRVILSTTITRNRSRRAAAPDKTWRRKRQKVFPRPINGPRHAWIVVGRYRNRRDSGPRLYLRTREERERCRRHVGDPGDDSPRFFLHGLLAYKAPVGPLVESRAFLALAGRLYMCVTRVPPGPFLPPGTEIVSRLTEHQPEGT